MSKGVISAPPPTPVRPTKRPTAKPAAMSGSKWAAQLKSTIAEEAPSPCSQAKRAPRPGRSYYSGLNLDQHRYPDRAQQNRHLLRTPVELGEVGRRIAEIGADPPRQQRPVENEHVVADLRRAGLRPADDAAGHRRAVDGVDQHEAPGKRQVAEQVDRGRGRAAGGGKGGGAGAARPGGGGG